jgi:catechol 2,3-dioxygenase-like lactoylglutathione lyase family enzyme
MEKKIKLTDVLVELHVPDFEIEKKFYSKLGFKVIWEYPSVEKQGYLVMKRDTSIIAFYCGNQEFFRGSYFERFPQSTVFGYGVEIVIHITNKPIEDYYHEVINKIDGKNLEQKLETKPWGKKDFRLIDPFGYYLCIREDENILLSK